MLKKYDFGGTFSFSSSPLSTLYPSTSSYTVPNYNNNSDLSSILGVLVARSLNSNNPN